MRSAMNQTLFAVNRFADRSALMCDTEYSRRRCLVVYCLDGLCCLEGGSEAVDKGALHC